MTALLLYAALVFQREPLPTAEQRHPKVGHNVWIEDTNGHWDGPRVDWGTVTAIDEEGVYTVQSEKCEWRARYWNLKRIGD